MIAEAAPLRLRFASRAHEFWRHPGRALAMLIYLPLALILKVAMWRFVRVTNPGRIGHLAFELDWFLKRRALGDFATIRPFLYLQDFVPAPNEALVAIYGQYVPLISNPLLRILVYPLSQFRMLRLDLSAAVGAHPADYPRLARAWGERPQLLVMPNDMRENGELCLRKMGLPPDAWFVCVHARDDVYSPNDDLYYYKGSRNCNIANYEEAVDEIIARGGWCLRMGEPGAKRLRPRAGVVNYHDSPFKSDWMDVFLCVNTRFFLGSSSGLHAVSGAAGRPCALANMIPAGIAFGLGPQDISIIKYLRDGAGRTMSFRDIFYSELSHNYSFLKIEDLTVVENSSQEIRDLAVEMLDMLDGRIEYTKEDNDLQAAFRALLNERHYSYFTTSRIGRDFLHQNTHLLRSDATIPFADKREVRDIDKSRDV